MLIVTRSLQQSVIVGEFDGFELMLKVTVLGVSGKKVRLGFEVVTDDPDRPLKAWEQLADDQPDPAGMPGMATTLECDWDLDWEEDVIEKSIDRDHNSIQQHVKKPIPKGYQIDQ
jgi:hypothetical protein